MNSNLRKRAAKPKGSDSEEVVAGATPLGEAVARIGDRWSLLVIDALREGPRRFGELADALPGIAPNVLSQRLKSLEKEKVIVGYPYSRRPLRMRYELTGSGRDLAGALRLLAHWGARVSDETEAPRHDLCGTPVEPRWYCPTCARTVDENENATDLRFI